MALDLLFEQDVAIGNERFMPASMICALLANIHRDPETEPYLPAEFMPGVPPRKTLEEELEEFAREIESGQLKTPSAEEIAQFKVKFESKFRSSTAGGAVVMTPVKNNG